MENNNKKPLFLLPRNLPGGGGNGQAGVATLKTERVRYVEGAVGRIDHD